MAFASGHLKEEDRTIGATLFWFKLGLIELVAFRQGRWRAWKYSNISSTTIAVAIVDDANAVDTIATSGIISSRPNSELRRCMKFGIVQLALVLFTLTALLHIQVPEEEGLRLEQMSKPQSVRLKELIKEGVQEVWPQLQNYGTAKYCMAKKEGWAVAWDQVMEDLGIPTLGKHRKILGVNESATQAEIRKKYRELSRKYHPDKNVGLAASNPSGLDEHDTKKMMENLNEAYEKLKAAPSGGESWMSQIWKDFTDSIKMEDQEQEQSNSKLDTMRQSRQFMNDEL